MQMLRGRGWSAVFGRGGRRPPCVGRVSNPPIVIRAANRNTSTNLSASRVIDVSYPSPPRRIKKRPFSRIVVADSRAARDSSFVETLQSRTSRPSSMSSGTR
jgi:hypothetical protein